jgi:hypothetical protein
MAAGVMQSIWQGRTCGDEWTYSWEVLGACKDYSAAIARAIERLGDRYLLAKPLSRIHSGKFISCSSAL